MKRVTLADRVVELFRQNPNRWIRERRIMEVGGTAGFRSRIDDARKRGMVIRNRVFREVGTDGVTYTRSEYMFVAETLLDLAEAAGIQAPSQTEAASVNP